MNALHALIDNLIDYAGLFPPAKLDMAPAVHQYAASLQSEHAYLLNHFICPAARLGEFTEAAGEWLNVDDPWTLSVLVGAKIDEGCGAIADLLEGPCGGALDVPAIEAKVSSAGEIDRAIEAIPEGVTAFFELPLDQDFRGPITALVGTGHAAKIRTGGITPDLYPSPQTVAKFIIACRDAQVPFKATAGLHHPLRHQNKTVGCMEHGFLNVFGAAAAAQCANANADDLIAILETEDPEAFELHEDGLSVGAFRFTTDDIQRTRHWARSYGSCSFDEPIEDLQGMGWM